MDLFFSILAIYIAWMVRIVVKSPVKVVALVLVHHVVRVQPSAKPVRIVVLQHVLLTAQ